jgi:hypothetical protein
MSGLIVNAGFEYRQEKSAFNPDFAYINNLGAGQGGATLPIAGEYSVRGTFQRAVRVPNVGELFAPTQVALDGVTDPCAGPRSLWTSIAGFVNDTLVNIGSISTQGVDVDSAYKLRLGDLPRVGNMGRLNFTFVGTYTSKFDTSPQPGATYQCAGFYGAICEAPLPKWRHTLTTTWGPFARLVARPTARSGHSSSGPGRHACTSWC